MKTLLNEEQTIRTLKRMCHQLLEMDYPVKDLILCGIKEKGYVVAQKMKGFMDEFSGLDVPLFPLEIKPFRDDEKRNLSASVTHMLVQDKVVILIDDVIYTGRSTRAGIAAILNEGRPQVIKLAVFIDRGHRELPIKPDVVGKNIPTSMTDHVTLNTNTFEVMLDENR